MLLKQFLCCKPLESGVMMCTGIYFMLSFILLLTNYEALQNFEKPPVFLLGFVAGLTITWIFAFCGVNRTSKCLIGFSLLFWTFVIIYWIGLIALTIGVKNKMACIMDESRCPTTMWLYGSNEGGGSVPTFASIKKALVHHDAEFVIYITDLGFLVGILSAISLLTVILQFTAPVTNSPAIIATRSKYLHFDNKEPNRRTLMYPFTNEPPKKKKPGKKPKGKGNQEKKNDQASGGDDSIVKILPFLILFSVTMLYSWYTLLSYFAELRTIDSCTCTGSCCKRCH